MKLSHKLIFGLTVFYPVFAFAASGNFRELVNSIIGILNPFVALFIGFALVLVLWGILKFIYHGGDEKKRAEGKMVMVYGVIALAVMVSLWGLVTIVATTFFGNSVLQNSPPADNQQNPPSSFENNNSGLADLSNEPSDLSGGSVFPNTDNVDQDSSDDSLGDRSNSDIPLSWIVSGEGDGAVYFYPLGEPCLVSVVAGVSGSDENCQRYNPGDVVSLTAEPPNDHSSVFDGWSGACEGTNGSTCYISASEAGEVVALFRPALPASLVIEPVSISYSSSAFPTSVFDSVDKIINIKYSGERPAEVKFTTELEGVFGWKGGMYPGEGGTCGLEITEDCSIIVSFYPGKDTARPPTLNKTPTKSYNSDASFLYNNGTDDLEIGLSLSGTAGPVGGVRLNMKSPTRVMEDISGQTRSITAEIGEIAEDKLEILSFSRPSGSMKGIVKNLSVNSIDGPFSIKRETCSETLVSGEKCVYTIAFTPLAFREENRQIMVSYDDGISIKKQEFNLKGVAREKLPISSLDAEKNLLVVYNSRSEESISIKDYYLAYRPLVSNANILSVSLPPEEIISPDEFSNNLEKPITDWLSSHRDKDIRNIVLIFGIPSRISGKNYYGLPNAGVEYTLHKNISEKFGKIYPAHLAMRTAPATKAYIDKLAKVYSLMSQKSVVISARGTLMEGGKYYIDGANPERGLSSLAELAKKINDGLSSIGAFIDYRSGNDEISVKEAKDIKNITSASDVSGYFSLGVHSWIGDRQVFGVDYALTSNTILPQVGVKFNGKSGWYVMETAESFNGQWGWTQGNYATWFAEGAFGGENYNNTPAGAVAHVDEPGSGGINDETYFSCWAEGKKIFADCAWESARTTYIMVLGDPWIRR